jgi:indolepyruvate ferredoxin oxidoreductase, alpha subunit
VLCPSFYRAQLLFNPSRWDKLVAAVRSAIIGILQSMADARRARHEF